MCCQETSRGHPTLPPCSSAGACRRHCCIDPIARVKLMPPLYELFLPCHCLIVASKSPRCMTRALGSDRVNESGIERANLFCATRQGGVNDFKRTCPAHIARAAPKADARKKQRVSSSEGGNMKCRQISRGSGHTMQHARQGSVSRRSRNISSSNTSRVFQRDIRSSLQKLS